MEELEGVELTKEEEAERGVFSAAITAVIVGFVSILFMGYKLTISATEEKTFEWVYILDPILMFVLAGLVYKKSRIAVIALFLYFLATRFHLVLYIQSVRQLIFAAIILTLFVYGIWGVFKFHFLKKSKNVIGG